jgi:hypothetical protein
MSRPFLTCSVLFAALLAGEAALADSSPPTVVTPQTTPAPQTPANPPPPAGAMTAPAIGAIPEKLAPGPVQVKPAPK